MDFYRIRTKKTRDNVLEVYPEFAVRGSIKDLMIRGGSFYAVWDANEGIWSRDEYDVQRLVDEALEAKAEELRPSAGFPVEPKLMENFGSRSWSNFKQFINQMPDNFIPLDTKLTWLNTEVKQKDYVSKRLPYNLEEGDISAWDELIGTLYAPEERMKIEWAIGAVCSGDSKKIQKFLVFYGSAGTGKSTMLNIVSELFHGYSTTFDGKALGSASNGAFSTEPFKEYPLVAIQHDGDLSRIDDNTRLNSIISHEEMSMNEKYKSSYTARIEAMLFMGTNQPVKITDAKSGIIRRLIDVHPTGQKLTPTRYNKLMAQIAFELGPIAHHCLQVYKAAGKNKYDPYRPVEMIVQTDAFFNYIETYFDIFKGQEYITLKQAWNLYKEWTDETGAKRLQMHQFRTELRNYFDDYSDKKNINGENLRSVYEGFSADQYKEPIEGERTYRLVLDAKESLFDRDMANQPAQLAKPDGTPSKKWANVKTTLGDITSRDLHYVKVPVNHVVIDFDLKGTNGTKALDRNLEAASLWPPTYAEVSKSGEGIHLHYQYHGSVDDLSPIYADGIEVKVYKGDASLRRKLTKCNGLPVQVISSGLPLKEKKEKMHKAKTIKTERGIRDLIGRNLRKEIHPGTKPSVDFIAKIIEEAHENGLEFDLTDLRPRVIAFANNSSNQAQECLKTVKNIKWSSVEEELPATPDEVIKHSDDRIVFYDVEVYENLFVICWKFRGDDKVVKMINPKPHEVEALFSFKLVGFYNRRYDNHIVYAAAMGTPIPQLFKLSTKLIEGNRGASFGAAYNLSYADIWDFSSEKKSLKKWEVDLGILHMELDIPWDKPVADEDIERVVEYCANDVRATEAVFENRKGDFVARQILAALSGLSVNDSTQNHTAKIIFGEDKKPQSKFVYTDLSENFPGYTFELGKSSYRGEDPGEGGYVYAEPGMYENVALLDVVSMHPRSIELLNLFGPYTQAFSELKEARVAIKRGDFATARKMLDGRLAPFLIPSDDLDDKVEGADTLAYALKIVINSVYGLTSAKFDNAFRDIRNKDNIVAKRGALFMIDLKHEIQKAGYQVCHIKTDSVKIPNADPRIIAKVMAIGQQYGYEFEHEATYDRFCLVNDAVYVAGQKAVPWEEPYPGFEWKAVGAQFQHPYVFKSLFSGEELTFEDYCEARSVVKGAMYLDFDCMEEPDHTKMRHVGRTGLFVPVLSGGAKLYRVNDGKYYAVANTKGHLWMEAHMAKELGASLFDDEIIDMAYFNKLKDTAVETIEKFGSFESFVNYKEG